MLPFFACLMLLLLTGWAGMAHAAEIAGGSIGGVELGVHAPGDGDEVPADGDNARPCLRQRRIGSRLLAAFP
jgi:hypothetical protein